MRLRVREGSGGAMPAMLLRLRQRPGGCPAGMLLDGGEDSARGVRGMRLEVDLNAWARIRGMTLDARQDTSGGMLDAQAFHLNERATAGMRRVAGLRYLRQGAAARVAIVLLDLRHNSGGSMG